MSADQNAEIVRRAYEAYARRDTAAVIALLAPDAEIVQTDELPWGGSYRGHDGAREFFRREAELTDATPAADRIIPAGETVVAVGRLRGQARETGRAIDLAIAHVWTVRDGLVARFAAYLDTPAMLHALGLERDDEDDEGDSDGERDEGDDDAERDDDAEDGSDAGDLGGEAGPPDA